MYSASFEADDVVLGEPLMGRTYQVKVLVILCYCVCQIFLLCL